MHNYGVAPYPTQGGCTMKEVEALKRVFQSHMPINAARLHCLVAIIIGLLKVRTVNFTEIADAFPGRAVKDSRYKRIQRFFRSYCFDYDMIAMFVVKLIGLCTGQKWRMKGVKYLILLSLIICVNYRQFH
jgi:hypothetical protein